MRFQEPFGICQNYPVRVNQWHLEHDLKTISSMGVKWLRTEFDWRKIEPRKGELELEWFDGLVRMCSSMGIHLLPVVAYTPRWMAPRFNLPPDPERFAELVGTLVKRYHHHVKHWEVWNEANSYYFWIGDAKQYAALLTSASAAAKRADPDSKILMCGLADPALPSDDFLFEALSHMDERSLDILNLHAYPGVWNDRRVEHWPALLQSLKRRSEAAGFDKPIWITETGISSRKGDSLADSEQESYLTRAFASLLGSGVVERVFWYRFKDETAEEDYSHDGRFGLVAQGTAFGNMRLAYRGYSRLSRTLPGGMSSLSRAFVLDRPKAGFESYSNLIRTLGQDFELRSSKFDGTGGAVSLRVRSESVRILWEEASDGRPRVSLSGSPPGAGNQDGSAPARKPDRSETGQTAKSRTEVN